MAKLKCNYVSRAKNAKLEIETLIFTNGFGSFGLKRFYSIFFGLDKRYFETFFSKKLWKDIVDGMFRQIYFFVLVAETCSG